MQRLHMTGREHLSKRGEACRLSSLPSPEGTSSFHENPNRPFEMREIV